MTTPLSTLSLQTFDPDKDFSDIYQISIVDCLSSQNLVVANAFLRLPPFPQDLEIPAELATSFYLTKIAVEPQFRGKGIGSLLLENAIQYAEQNQVPIFNKPVPEIPQVPSLSRDELTKAYRRLTGFYQRHGFEKYNERFMLRVPRANAENTAFAGVLR